jgi:hypothetical protein
MELMNVKIELWPISADNVGLWLISGDDAWRPTLPVDQASDIHWEVENLLRDAGILDATTLIHSSSWRCDGPSMVVTYFALIQADELVLSQWPDAKPISLALADAVGKPPVHEATEAPTPREIDVLIHALRHTRFLLDTDDESAQGITLPMRRHISHLQPALAGMYRSA